MVKGHLTGCGIAGWLCFCSFIIYNVIIYTVQ